MAEVRLRLGHGVYNIAHGTRNKFLLEPQSKLDKCATQVSDVSAGFLLCDIQNGLVNSAEPANTAPPPLQDVTVGASRDYYTTVTPLPGNDLRGRGSVAQLYHDIGLSEEVPLSTFSRDTTLDRTPFVARYGTTVTRSVKLELRRTFCTSGFARRQQSRSEPLYKTKNGYYDILEVSPNATQAQIKTAYYKQSFIYHPDKNNGSEEATVRFSDVTEAYHVLGNKGLRRKYDRGILQQTDLTGANRPSVKDTSSSAKQPGPHRSVAGLHNRDVYDFDKFIKSHYSEQLQRDREIKARREEMLRKKNESLSDGKLGRMMEMSVALLLSMALALVFNIRRGGN